METRQSAFAFYSPRQNLGKAIYTSFTRNNLCCSHGGGRSKSIYLSLLPKPAVVFVTPDGFSQDHDKAAKLAKQALDGGISLIQIRDVPALSSEILSVTEALLAAGVPPKRISVNGIPPSTVGELSPDLGVHIRENKIAEFLEEAKQTMGPNATISCSIHSVESAQMAIAHGGPSYLQVGTMYPSTSHPDKIPEGLPVLRAVREAVGPSQMIVGIGGINEGNLVDVIRNGADGVAVISSISKTNDPGKAAAGLMTLCQGAYGDGV